MHLKSLNRKLFNQFVSSIFNTQKAEFYRENGYCIIPNVFSDSYIKGIQTEAYRLISSIDETEVKTIFDTSVTNSSKYYLDSGDKIRYFLEKDSFDSNGNLINPLSDCVNKIGHGKL